MTKLTHKQLKTFLDSKVKQYNTLEFIETDPVQIPHLFSKKEDIEVAGFLAATISWGNRKSIIKNCHKMMDLMEHSPFDFVKNHTTSDLKPLETFVHRTFNGLDFITFIKGLQHIYTNHNGIEAVFAKYAEKNSLQNSIHNFKKVFFEIEHLQRTQKHISDPLKKSAAKRLNMYLRWMIRDDIHGVDLGIWKTLNTAQLSCPLDVHSGNVARKLGLLTRTQNDAKALAELDAALRQLDPKDPVKYDFALFGLGVFEGF